MKYSLFFSAVLCLWACKKDCGCSPAPKSASIDLYYTDSIGHNLFDSGSGYFLKDFVIFVKRGGVYERYSNNPEMFFNYSDSNKRRIIRLFPVFYDARTKSEMIIQVKSGVSDSLVCEAVRSGYDTEFKRAWLNGVEMGSFITIRK